MEVNKIKTDLSYVNFSIKFIKIVHIKNYKLKYLLLRNKRCSLTDFYW